MLLHWLAQSHVTRWWGDAARAMQHARQCAPESHAIIVADGVPVGYLCWQEPPKEELEAAGLTELPRDLVDIDILIGEPELLGQGVGSQALEILLARLRSEQAVGFAGLGTSSVNTNAIRCYAKAGFRLFREFQDPEWGRCEYLIAEVQGAPNNSMQQTALRAAGDAEHRHPNKWKDGRWG
jgi:RimJ/RimL family protein N-acetyltransferase